MSQVVGIPRGLFYYQYYPLWEAFFARLGIETRVSGPTDKRIFDDGIRACVGEACLPVKLYYGHVLALKDRVDYLFIPRYTSVSRYEYVCPKFGGLPDMLRCSIPDLPPLLDPEINLRKSTRTLYRAAEEIGGLFGRSRREARSAYDNALACYRTHRQRQVRPVLTNAAAGTPERRLRILLLGHVYNTGDAYLNMRIAEKIASLGGEVLTLEMLDTRSLRHHAGALDKPLFWYYATKALGCAHALIQRPYVDGIIYLTCFGCGIDSFVGYMVEHRARRYTHIPFTTITLDEHTGEAGLNTRIEAFMDTIHWRIRHDRDIPAHG